MGSTHTALQADLIYSAYSSLQGAKACRVVLPKKI